MSTRRTQFETGDRSRGLIERLTRALETLPGIGSKSAERLAHHLLKCPIEEALELSAVIEEARRRIQHCQQCFHLTESEEPLCAICRDPRRDPSLVCVVENPRDLLALERSGVFQGVYHVLLGSLAPLQGIGPEQLTLDALEQRVRGGQIREVILATNPTLEGDGTALLVTRRLAPLDVRVTRLARGLASGGTLEFANKDMVSDAFEGRHPY